MLKVNDTINVKIEKLSYGTDCIARIQEKTGGEKFVVFVSGAVVEDVAKIKITSVNKSFAKGAIVEIITPSPYRTTPFCPLYNACGSCQLQNYDYDFLIKQKQIVLKDIFKNMNTTVLPFIKSPEIFSYRHKIQYPARQTKNSKRVLLGYFKNNSHILTNIKYCPIQPDIINEISQFIRSNWILGCYDEKTDKGLLKNVVFRINSSLDSVLITLVLNIQKNNLKEKEEKEIIEFFKKIKKNFNSSKTKVKGCFINFNPKKTNFVFGDETKKISGCDFIIEILNNKRYKIGPLSFFQVNPKAALELFEIVKSNVKTSSNILDAYGGVGAIGIYLKEKADSIVLVEENNEASKFAFENFKLNKVKNFEIFTGDAKKHFLNFEKENRTFDYAILDPPRSGCEKEGLYALSKIAKNIIYVSCNPQTLKRDVDYLLSKNFKLKSLQGADLFPYTYHIEAAAVLEKE